MSASPLPPITSLRWRFLPESRAGIEAARRGEPNTADHAHAQAGRFAEDDEVVAGDQRALPGVPIGTKLGQPALDLGESERAQVEGEINNLQTADVWLQKIHDITAHMSDLARLAGDTTIDQNSRDDLQKEFAQAQEEIGRISNTLVQQGYNFQPAQAQTDGTTAKEDSANVSLLGFVGDSDMNISSDTQAKNALAQVSAGLEQVASTRTAIGDNIRHLEDTLSNLLEEPECMKELIAAISEYRFNYLKLLVDNLKPDAILSHDDWGSKRSMFMSPATWREIIKPYYFKMYNYAHDHGVLILHHADSFLEPIVEDMVELGIDIWQAILPQNDIPKIQKQLAGRMVLMGGIDAAIVVIVLQVVLAATLRRQ